MSRDSKVHTLGFSSGWQNNFQLFSHHQDFFSILCRGEPSRIANKFLQQKTKMVPSWKLTKSIIFRVFPFVGDMKNLCPYALGGSFVVVMMTWKWSIRMIRFRPRRIRFWDPFPNGRFMAYIHAQTLDVCYIYLRLPYTFKPNVGEYTIH